MKLSLVLDVKLASQLSLVVANIFGSLISSRQSEEQDTVSITICYRTAGEMSLKRTCANTIFSALPMTKGLKMGMVFFGVFLDDLCLMKSCGRFTAKQPAVIWG